MGDLSYLQTPFRLNGLGFHDWTQHLAITRIVREEGDVCVCWVGTFALVTNDSGGWQPWDGSALGVLPDGSTYVEFDWPGWAALAQSINETSSDKPRWSLAVAITLAQQLAELATALLPVVDASLAAGDTLDQLEAATDEWADSPEGKTAGGGLLGLALVFLWLSEQVRRDSEVSG